MGLDGFGWIWMDFVQVLIVLCVSSCFFAFCCAGGDCQVFLRLDSAAVVGGFGGTA